MDSEHLCSICHKAFSRADSMKRHMLYSHTMLQEEKIKRFACPICQNCFTRKGHLKRHVETLHQGQSADPPPNPPSNEVNYQTLITKIDTLEGKIDDLKKTSPSVTNNNLNIICVTNHDNYLDMLTDRMGFDLAIDYIKDCALSDVVGDCKLIEKIYASSFTMNRKKSHITYHDEQNQTVTETKESFGHKLANNLQKSYLKSINFLINRNLETRGDPNKFLEMYDVMTWNAHIYRLSEQTQQHKIMNQLEIQITP
jgi:hypothetical protein